MSNNRTKAPSADEPSMDLSSRLRLSKITEDEDKDDKYASRSTSTRANGSSRATSSRGSTSGGQSSSHYPGTKASTIKESASRGTVRMSTVDNVGRTVYLSKIDSKTAHMSKIDSPGRTVHMSKVDSPGKTAYMSKVDSPGRTVHMSKVDSPGKTALMSKVDSPGRTVHLSKIDEKSDRPRLHSSKDVSERPRLQSSNNERSERPRLQSSNNERSERPRHQSSSAFVPVKSTSIRPVTATRAPSHIKTILSKPDDIKMASRQSKIASLPPEERKKQERWAQDQIKYTGACPAQLDWIRVDVHRYYRCEGGNHVITDELLAEGKGGIYFLPAQTLPHMYCDTVLWGPYYIEPEPSSGNHHCHALLQHLTLRTYAGPKPKPYLAPDRLRGHIMLWDCPTEAEEYHNASRAAMMSYFASQGLPVFGPQNGNVQGFPAPPGRPRRN